MWASASQSGTKNGTSLADDGVTAESIDEQRKDLELICKRAKAFHKMLWKKITRDLIKADGASCVSVLKILSSKLYKICHTSHKYYFSDQMEGATYCDLSSLIRQMDGLCF